MTKNEAKDVCDQIDHCGWEVLMINGFEKIKDENFHELRRSFLDSIENIRKYINEPLRNVE